MRKITSGIVIAALACILAVFAGCATSASSSSASGASSSSASSASNAASAVSNGEHTIKVTLSGGSGKASVESPAKLNVSDGKMTAVIVWSSSSYDKMVVDGVEYLPVPRAGNSTFEIPVTALDKDLAIQAETTAMSSPHMIDYTLRFDSSSIA